MTWSTEVAHPNLFLWYGVVNHSYICTVLRATLKWLMTFFSNAHISLHQVCLYTLYLV